MASMNSVTVGGIPPSRVDSRIEEAGRQVGKHPLFADQAIRVYQADSNAWNLKSKQQKRC